MSGIISGNSILYLSADDRGFVADLHPAIPVHLHMLGRTAPQSAYKSLIPPIWHVAYWQTRSTHGNQ